MTQLVASTSIPVRCPRDVAHIDDLWRCVECRNGVSGLRGELSRLRQEFLHAPAKLAATYQELQDLKATTKVTEVETAAAAATEEEATLVAQPATEVLPAEVTSPTPAVSSPNVVSATQQ